LAPGRIKRPCRGHEVELSYQSQRFLVTCVQNGAPHYADIVRPALELNFRQSLLKLICSKKKKIFLSSYDADDYAVASSLSSAYVNCDKYRFNGVTLEYDVVDVPSRIEKQEGFWWLLIHPNYRLFKVFSFPATCDGRILNMNGQKKVLDDLPYPWKYENGIFSFLALNKDGKVFVPCDQGEYRDQVYSWKQYCGPLRMRVDKLTAPYDKYAFVLSGKKSFFYRLSPQGINYQVCVYHGSEEPKSPFNGECFVIRSPYLQCTNVFNMPFFHMTCQQAWECKDITYDQYGNVISSDYPEHESFCDLSSQDMFV